MKTISASECRIPPDVFNNVSYCHERVCIERRDGVCVYIISQKDMDQLTGGFNIKEMLKEQTRIDAIGKIIDGSEYGTDYKGEKK